jgi:F-type H+-transporting ATPase subunit a
MSDAVQHALPYVAIANAAVVALLLVALAVVVVRKRLDEVPGPVQNAAEWGLEWFVRLAKSARPDGAAAIAPFLASLFAFILFCNLLAVVPLPLLGIPPTSYYSATLALALAGTVGVLVLSARFKGVAGALKHLFWPNPLQTVSEASHVLSLSLRLFGNIGGELLVAMLVASAVPYGIPLLIHILGLVPAVVQPVVFTLLISNFLAEAVHGAPERPSLPDTAGTPIGAEAP